MRLAVMQPYFFPYIGYFQLINAVDRYIVYSHFTFIKGGWINRNRLLMRDGNIALTTVPLVNISSNRLISDTLIDNTKPWKSKLLKTLQAAYSRKPYYQETLPVIEKVLDSDHQLLKRLILDSINAVAQHLDISTEILEKDDSYSELEEKLKLLTEEYTPFSDQQETHPTRKVARILEMCKTENCTEYINAIGGRELYDADLFSQYGIRLRFLKTNNFEYYQGSADAPFVPNLSIIDVLMNNGKEGTKRLLNEYTLI